MTKTVLPLLMLLLFMQAIPVFCQPPGTDTFFLVKKKGLLGKLGQSISTSDTQDNISVIKANPYVAHIGKVIRHIKIVRLGFERDINDTTRYNNNFGSIVANAFHNKTTANVIGNNLFFDAGDRLNPYLISDNEKFLRDQSYLQDALIQIDTVPGNKYMVDVLVMVKDVFSLGGSAEIASAKQMRFDLKEENLKGTGSRLLLTTLYNSERKPRFGFGAEFLKRNIKGTFVNFAAGFKSFNDAITSGQSEESAFYISLDKPFITPYMSLVGGLDLSLNQTKNNFVTDSLYQREFRYSYQKADGWLGYSFGSSKQKFKKQDGRTRAFAAIRGLYQHFNHLPGKALDTFNYRLSNVNALLASISLFRQNFTRTNFIYGFGRNEDLPEGFDVSLIGGWVNRKDSIGDGYIRRPYYAIDGQRTHLNAKGFFSSYTLRIGGYRRNSGWEDVGILAGVEHFTRKKRLRPEWYHRQFYSVFLTRQFNTTPSQQPLFLSSAFGLPYFDNGDVAADLRATAKTEAVFYNLHKFWGFRLAPFVFADMCVVKQVGASLSKSDLYTAIGAGVRTRNESLVFGTLELKAFYFPRTIPGMSNFSVQVGSNIRFRYSNVLVKKPDFIVAN
jgi:hypothetical protein